MALDDETRDRLDSVAEEARAEFEKHWREWTVRDVAEWWDRWCRVGRTNHDRLGRVLLDVTGVRRPPPRLIKRINGD